jgi:hypothetical protein
MAPGAKKVHVEQHDIDRAVQQDSSHCVVATAVARAFPDAVRITVDTQLIRFTHALTGRRVAYLTPLKVQAYVVAFDAGDPIPPFSFSLSDPVPVRQRQLTDEGKRRQLVSKDKRKGKPANPRKPRPLLDAVITQPNTVDASAPDAWRPPPLVFKRRTRQYGMRVLRANQERGYPADHKIRTAD